MNHYTKSTRELSPLNEDWNKNQKRSFTGTCQQYITNSFYNLTKYQLLWREWHELLGHLDNTKMKEIGKDGYIPNSLININVPLCATCQYGKSTRKYLIKSQLRSLTPSNIEAPGHCVSIDQMMSSTPGRQITLSGKPSTNTYSCATIFFDHYSRKVYTHFQ